MPSDLVTALRALATSGLPVELCYHPSADPGDGTGWVLVIGETHNYGGLDVLVAHAVRRAGEVSDG